MKASSGVCFAEVSGTRQTACMKGAPKIPFGNMVTGKTSTRRTPTTCQVELGYAPSLPQRSAGEQLIEQEPHYAVVIVVDRCPLYLPEQPVNPRRIHMPRHRALRLPTGHFLSAPEPEDPHTHGVSPFSSLHAHSALARERHEWPPQIANQHRRPGRPAQAADEFGA